MIKLNKYLQDEYMVKRERLKSQAVADLAAEFGVTYGSVYRWLKSGDYFVYFSDGKPRVYRLAADCVA